MTKCCGIRVRPRALPPCIFVFVKAFPSCIFVTSCAGTQALLDNRELKQKLSTLLKEEADRKQRVRARRTVAKLDEKQVVPK